VDEFELIGRYFSRPVDHTALGVGDDAALIDPTPGCQTVVACDMLVEGVHFLPGADPRGLGHKALAVNLSDLAAMGARPRQALLGIALPEADAAWLAAFAEGFAALAAQHGVDWVGGDTTRGPRNLCVTVLGELPPGAALLRSGARPGDELWVSGAPGLAALGLAQLRGDCALTGAALDAALARLHTPEPRVALGIALRGVASACIDVSDGVLADLGHLLRASGRAAGAAGSAATDATADSATPLSAELDWPALAGPLRAVLQGGTFDDALLERAVLAGGDDYELLFSAPPAHRQRVVALAGISGVALERIGRVGAAGTVAADAAEASGGRAHPAITLIDGGSRTLVAASGYRHFG